MKTDWPILDEKRSFKMMGLFFFSNLGYIVFLLKLPPNVIGLLIRSMKFRPPDITLYLYKFTIRAFMEYGCHVWAGAPSCYLDVLDML